MSPCTRPAAAGGAHRVWRDDQGGAFPNRCRRSGRLALVRGTGGRSRTSGSRRLASRFLGRLVLQAYQRHMDFAVERMDACLGRGRADRGGPGREGPHAVLRDPAQDRWSAQLLLGRVLRFFLGGQRRGATPASSTRCPSVRVSCCRSPGQISTSMAAGWCSPSPKRAAFPEHCFSPRERSGLFACTEHDRRRSGWRQVVRTRRRGLSSLGSTATGSIPAGCGRRLPAS